jgi:hypothetical protein
MLGQPQSKLIDELIDFIKILPFVRNFYHADMSNQQRSLVQFIDMILLVCNDKEVFLSKMEILADIHYKKGVTAIEYNSFGRVSISSWLILIFKYIYVLYCRLYL